MASPKTVDKKEVKKLFSERPKDSHKGDFGRLLVIGGSGIYSGAPALVGLAALRSGVDLVQIAAPERAADIIAGFSPDLITRPLRGDFLSGRHLQELKEEWERFDALVIGNGLGRKEETLKTVGQFLAGVDKPCVVDADALHAVTKESVGKNFVLTPHPREFRVLTGKSIEKKGMEEKAEIVKRTSGKWGCTILLKGYTDIISDGRRVKVNKTGTPLMTVGGTGDVLAGICGALLVRGAEPLRAVSRAAYINGKAGEIAGNKRGEGLIASDLLKEIPEVIKKA